MPTKSTSKKPPKTPTGIVSGSPKSTVSAKRKLQDRTDDERDDIDDADGHKDSDPDVQLIPTEDYPSDGLNLAQKDWLLTHYAEYKKAKGKNKKKKGKNGKTFVSDRLPDFFNTFHKSMDEGKRKLVREFFHKVSQTLYFRFTNTMRPNSIQLLTFSNL